MKNLTFTKQTISKVPQTPGVYKYFDNSARIIYIGKANNLRSRMYSYTLSSLHGKTKDLVKEIVKFSYVLVDSEIEALLLEAKLVGLYMPKYNVSLRDNKKPLCIRITSTKYPLVFTARNQDRKSKDLAFFGPFPSSYTVNSILSMLRRIFPYSQHKLGSRACLYNQLGLCNPCPNTIEKLDGDYKLQQYKLYKQNIRRIKLVLNGKFPSVINNLEGQMKLFSKRMDFESAQSVKRQIEQLKYLTRPTTNISVYLKDPNFLEDARGSQLKHLHQVLSKSKMKFTGQLNRIECYDVAHLAGSSPTASMVTFIDATEAKEFYRHFRLKVGGNDTGSLKETIHRRSKYFNSWGRPDLIVVDGGKPQVSVFVEELKETGIPIVGIAKRFENLIVPYDEKQYEVIKLTPPSLYLVQRMRDEAHRFARRYHHQLVRKSLLAQ